jgi:hypothetical protein
MFKVMCNADIAAKVPSRMMGRPATVTSVLRKLRKKMNTTSAAMNAPINSSRIASLKLSLTKMD